MEVEKLASAIQHLNVNSNNEAFKALPGESSVSSVKIPVMEKLSRVNGIINSMSDEELRSALKDVNVNSLGMKSILQRRLKNYYKKLKLGTSQLEETWFDHLVVIDFEATCDRKNSSYVHEIIEFPAVVIDVRNLKIHDKTFQRYCKPVVNPILTDFCTELTGITQDNVDSASNFPDVLEEFQSWLKEQGIVKRNKFAIVTDGPWDMAKFMRTQVELNQIEYPSWAKRWINLRKAFRTFYQCKTPVNLNLMLDSLAMKFVGRPHCGLHDSTNIAAIAVALLQDGCVLKLNEAAHQFSLSHVVLPPNSPPASKISPDRRSSSSSLSSPSSRSSARTKARFPNGQEVEQEGESVEDLLLLTKLQQNKSKR